MSQEIERKFIVGDFQNVLDAIHACQSHNSINIKQGYLAVEPQGNEVRLRCKTALGGWSKHFLTVKSGQGLVREEAETKITEEQFATLWPLTAGRRLEKDRYTISFLNGLVVEVDVFNGALAGLILAEIEFINEEQAAAFQPFDWLGHEVTTDPRFKNQYLMTLENIHELPLY